LPDDDPEEDIDGELAAIEEAVQALWRLSCDKAQAIDRIAHVRSLLSRTRNEKLPTILRATIFRVLLRLEYLLMTPP